ncbi:uncharacterized protein LOC110254926 isoform X2 [Exaiptasia diaphana]|uniref:Uncharacterized protein n=1 Tax=Exaiptasia diaphana TaxID=2652724 RepID=A0A913YB91_EXADI|nr:uncharacterized protein LOC110254926 isoform X1 [Exaiptasia diaphana]XP_020917642.1 uncharacterized protein LOC110254926 isoform X2 [Exaiptasia diaphana]KXJ05945.1 hypothetical protein AC249_AIPGENE14163 [Exaiptasia diaphana]
MANLLTILLVLLLISAVVYIDAGNSTAANFTTSTPGRATEKNPTTERTPSKNSTKCLSSLNEIEAELSSKVHWRSISRALFPLFQLPSLYVKVTLRLISDELNQNVDKVKKFTWAESCAFVTDVSLEAVTAFSLGTVWPQRRQTELVLTVHDLCNETVFEENGFKDENDMWRYALLTLQDIAIMPNLSDPRVNTAQCVVAGHEGDADQPIVYPDWYNWRGIWIVVASIPFTIAFTWFALNWLAVDGNHSEEHLSKTLIFTSYGILILPIFEGIYITSKHIYIARDFSLSGIVCHFFLFLLFLLISFVIQCITTDPNPDLNPRPVRKLRWGKFVVLPCIYQLVHHLLWVLCGGIPADPAWAIPLFLCECFVVLTLLCAIYLSLKNSGVRCHMCHMSIFAVAILLGIFILAISFYGCNVAVSLTDNLLVVIMVGALLWLFKNSDFGSGLAGNQGGQNAPVRNINNDQELQPMVQ